MNSTKLLLAASAMLLTISGCQSVKSVSVKEAGQPAEIQVSMIGTTGQKIGSVKLQSVADGVRIQLQVSGLKPGMHGFHIHENGVCETPEFTTAGAHFNTYKKEHGFLNPKGTHVGDLPNLAVDAQGNGQMDVTTKLVVLPQDKPNSLLKPGGTSLIIHEQVDDFITDPSGNSGKRVACGVVK